MRGLNDLYSSRKVSFSLPSLRVDSVSLGLFKEISEVRKSGLTFAVETANPQWQKEVRKTVTLEKTIAVMREAKAQGWRAAKFYFMVGLPPGFDEDESSSIVEFLRSVRAATGMSLNVNVAAFIPKPHTPWQRARQMGEEEATARITAVKAGLGRDGFKIGYHAPLLSLLEGIVARGDERAALLVWTPTGTGRGSMRGRSTSSSMSGAPPCGRGMGRPGRNLQTEGRGGEAALGRGRARALDERDNGAAAGGRPEEGEAPVARPATDGSPATAAAVPEKRILFSFSKSGAASFISHLDLMTVFERAFARAGFDLRFTEGFNPKPRLEFANPLSLGLDSREEIASVDLYDELTEEHFIEAMNASLPDGLRVQRAGRILHDGVSRRRSLMALYWGADFELIGGAGEARFLRLPATGPSIRRTLEAEGTWQTVQARRLATWASGPRGEPLSYSRPFPHS